MTNTDKDCGPSDNVASVDLVSSPDMKIGTGKLEGSERPVFAQCRRERGLATKPSQKVHCTAEL